MIKKASNPNFSFLLIGIIQYQYITFLKSFLKIFEAFLILFLLSQIKC